MSILESTAELLEPRDCEKLGLLILAASGAFERHRFDCGQWVNPWIVGPTILDLETTGGVKQTS